MTSMLQADDLLPGAAGTGESDGGWWLDHCESSSFIDSHTYIRLACFSLLIYLVSDECGPLKRVPEALR